MSRLLGKILGFLGDGVTDIPMDPIGYNESWWKKTLEPICDLLGEILVPLLILIGAAGTIYAIVLGVQYSKSESSEKRDEAKKRLVNALIGIIVLLVLLILLLLFCKNVEDIGRWVTDIINSRNGTPTA